MPIDLPTTRTKLEYFIVDVFTDTALEGNPLAVVMNTADLSTEKMQAIAREFNLSETTFVERRAPEIEQREGVRVRIFTTQEELPFAGHPTLGTATVLRMTAPEVVANDTVTLALNVGAVPVRFAAEGSFGEMTQRDPEFGAELDAAEVARLCGLGAEDLNPALQPQVVSTGTAFAIVVLRSCEALGRLNMKQQEATAWLRERGARWFFVLAPTGENEPARVRSGLEQLGALGVTAVLLEGGPHLAGAFLDAGEIDEIRLFLAPLLLGGSSARDPLEGKGVEQISEALRALTFDCERVGEDLLISARLREW